MIRCQQMVGFPEQQCSGQVTHYERVDRSTRKLLCEYHADLITSYGREVYRLGFLEESQRDEILAGG